MTLEEIETFTLGAIGHTRYHTLSTKAANTDDGRDFALLHRCVYLAREEIKRNTFIPGILKKQTIAVSANDNDYDLASDFDLPANVRYLTSGGAESNLTRVYHENILQKLGGSKTTELGTPSLYLIAGNVSDLIQIEFYLVPDSSATAYVFYKPVLANLTTSTDEDILMKKYPQTVIKLASAFFFQLIKKDGANFDKWYLLGTADFRKIDFLERSADSSYREIPSSSIRNQRMGRFTK